MRGLTKNMRITNVSRPFFFHDPNYICRTLLSPLQNNVLYFFLLFLVQFLVASSSHNFFFFLRNLFDVDRNKFLSFYCICYNITYVLCCFFFFYPGACGILPPWPGIKPAPPALEDEGLTSRSPRKSQVVTFYHNHLFKGYALFWVGGHLQIWQMCCCVSYWWSSWIVLGSGSTFKEYHLLFFVSYW